MQQEEVKAVFDRMAEGYDEQWQRLAPINEALHLLMGGILAPLPERASVLCVGAGTGAEILALGRRFPYWRFTAVDPSAAMLEVCRRRLQEQGMAERCSFHAGYLESLPPGEPFHVATSLLVSQFILDREARTAFFGAIAERLLPGGILINSDLSADTASATYEGLLKVWLNVMRQGGVPGEGVDKMREAYARDVGVLPALEVERLIEAGGFEGATPFFQAGLIRAWYATRSA